MSTLKAVRLRPIGEQIVIKRQDPADITPGGIVLPDQSKEVPSRGTVIAVGSGHRIANSSERMPLEVATGDEVLFGKYAGTVVEVDDQELVVIREQDVLAVLGY